VLSLKSTLPHPRRKFATGGLERAVHALPPRRLGNWTENPFQIGSIPATTNESDAFAKDLKKRGFKFLGLTTVYATYASPGNS
jgi:3-methyladenine DNA glycosylase Tag